MAVDIGEIIKFQSKSDVENRLPKITINAVLNIPILVRKWKIENSRFTDGNPDGQFVELELRLPDGGEFRLNTGSGVIISQLDEIRRSYPDGTEFECVIRRVGKAYKMFPARERK